MAQNVLSTHGKLKKFTETVGGQKNLGWKVTWQKDTAKVEGLTFAFTVNGDADAETKIVVSNEMKDEALKYIKSIKSDSVKLGALNEELNAKLEARDDRNETKKANADVNTPSWMNFESPYTLARVEEVSKKTSTGLTFADIKKQMEAKK